MNDVAMIMFLVMFGALLFCSVIIIRNRGLVGLFQAFAEILAAAWDRLAYGPARPRAKRLPHRSFPLVGCDEKVAAAIERDAPLEVVIGEAELLAYREHNAAARPGETVGPKPGEYDYVLASRNGRSDTIQTGRSTVSLHHVTATTPGAPKPVSTPKMTYSRYPACPDCEFEMLTYFGGEVAVPVRTVMCRKHWEAER